MHAVYIANPIYDTVFINLMENNRIARFFIETIIDHPVDSISVSPQEYTYYCSTPQTLAESGFTPEEIDELKKVGSFLN